MWFLWSMAVGLASSNWSCADQPWSNGSCADQPWSNLVHFSSSQSPSATTCIGSNSSLLITLNSQSSVCQSFYVSSLFVLQDTKCIICSASKSTSKAAAFCFLSLLCSHQLVPLLFGPFFCILLQLCRVSELRLWAGQVWTQVRTEFLYSQLVCRRIQYEDYSSVVSGSS